MTGRSLLASTTALPVLGQIPIERIARKGRLKQSVSRWCFNKIPLEDFSREVARLGLVGIDLLNPPEWPIVQKFGLVVTLGYPGGDKVGPLNRKESHDGIEKQFREALQKAAAAKVPNLIIMSGNRAGMSDQEGLENCVAGLSRIKPIAEDEGVTVVLELLNSKVDHKDYMADRTAWAVEAVKRVNSPRIKVLYDIYHMQIMEGDIIRTIRENIQYLSHFHTGGNPGRHEIDETQELNYRAIAQAIVEAGFSGYFAHEFTPSRPDPLKSLAQAVDICDV
jgi:hydroxypyruvate isomerase